MKKTTSKNTLVKVLCNTCKEYVKTLYGKE